jgi:copper(I)-binding protein
MKQCGLAGLALALGIATAGAQPTSPPPPAAGVAATNTAGPKIRFATPMYDFGRAQSGELVKHTYIFTNIGDETLILANVQPQCGCTTAGEWTKQVEPGQTGSIPIQFNTANQPSQVFKQVTVTCNDKSQGTLFLQLRGSVYKPLEVNPQLAVLNLSPDVETASTIVTITNSTEEPLTLSAPESNNKAFKAELKTIAPGKGYQLVVSSVPPLTAGGVQAQITMKTSWTNPAVLSVSVYANVQPAIAVIPSHITLLPGPLANPQTPSVTIQNNSTNRISLSDPAVNTPAAQAQIKETQPGRSFTVLTTFPQGFELPPGQQLELTVKTSNPKYPVVRVPITQMPRPAAPPPALRPPPPISVQPPPSPLQPVKRPPVELPPLPPDFPLKPR